MQYFVPCPSVPDSSAAYGSIKIGISLFSVLIPGVMSQWRLSVNEKVPPFLLESTPPLTMEGSHHRQTSKSPKRQMNAQPNEKVDDEVCAESDPKPPFLPFLQSSIQRLTEQRSNHKMDITVGSLALEHGKVHTVP